MSKGEATDKWSTPGNGSTSHNGCTTGAGHFLGYGKAANMDINLGNDEHSKSTQCQAQGLYNNKQEFIYYKKYRANNFIGSLRTNPNAQPGSESVLQLRSDPEWLLGSDPQGNSNHEETQPEFIHKPKLRMSHAINELHSKTTKPQTGIAEQSDSAVRERPYHKCSYTHTKPYQCEKHTKARKPKKCKSRTDKKTTHAYLNSKKKMQIRQKERKLKKLKEKINQIKKVKRPPHRKLPSLMTLLTKKNKIEEVINNKKKLNPNSLPFPPDKNKPASNTPCIISNANNSTNLGNITPSLFEQKTNLHEAQTEQNITTATIQPRMHIENNILLWNCNKATWSLKKRAVL